VPDAQGVEALELVSTTVQLSAGTIPQRHWVVRMIGEREPTSTRHCYSIRNPGEMDTGDTVLVSSPAL
jgi:hypothetical protein